MRDKLICSLLGSTLVVGCVSDIESTSETTATPLIVEPGAQLWPQNGNEPVVISVCFASQAYSAPGFLSVPGFVPRVGEGPGYRDWIIDAMQETWGRVANIAIDVYDSCPSADPPAGWIVIHFNDNGHSEEADRYGYNPDGHNTIYLNQNEGQGMPPTSFDHHACGWVTGQPRPAPGGQRPYFDSLEKLRKDAIHELGHLLGFSHNYFDPDAPPELACIKPPMTSGDRNPGDFDYGSVMDYCTHPCEVDFWGSTRPYFKVRLSDWDVHNVQQLYGTKYSSGTDYFVGHRNTVIEVPAANFAAGQHLEVWDYKGGANEQWNATQTLQVRARAANNLAWDIRGGVTSPTSGTPIQLYPALAQPNQQFRLKGVEWRGVGDNCLEALSSASGAKVELRRCTGIARQKWDVAYSGTSTQLRLGGTSLCAASPSATPADGLDVALESCSLAGSRALLAPRGNGQLAVSGKCFDTETGTPTGAVISTGTGPRSLDTYDATFFPTRRGHTLQLYACKSPGTAILNQQFHVRGAITGLDGQCVDIQGGTGYRGADVQLYPCTGNVNQTWDAYIF